MLAAYQDINGCVGSREPAPDLRADADAAMRALLDTIHDLAGLTDRHDGDSGADVALIEGWTERAERLCEEVRAHLGTPRVLRHGVLVPAGMVR